MEDASPRKGGTRTGRRDGEEERHPGGCATLSDPFTDRWTLVNGVFTLGLFHFGALGSGHGGWAGQQVPRPQARPAAVFGELAALGWPDHQGSESREAGAGEHHRCSRCSTQDRVCIHHPRSSSVSSHDATEASTQTPVRTPQQR